jgi:HK97 family phage prohead protease
MEPLQTKLLSITDAEVKFMVGGGGAVLFGGYASVFNVADSEADVVVPGAFTDVLGTTPMMFFNHRYLDVPIGRWLAVEEDTKGLKVQGELTPGNYMADAVHAAFKHGTITGLSIGYRVAPGGSQTVGGKRYLKKFKALPEISVVTNPANDDARVDLTSIKSAIDEMQTIEQFESFLREVGGFSKQATLAVISKAKSVLSLRESGEQKSADDSGDPSSSSISDQLASRIERLAAFRFPNV